MIYTSRIEILIKYAIIDGELDSRDIAVLSDNAARVCVDPEELIAEAKMRLAVLIASQGASYSSAHQLEQHVKKLEAEYEARVKDLDRELNAKLQEPKYKRNDDKADDHRDNYNERKEDLKEEIDKKIIDLLKGWQIPESHEEIIELMDFLKPHFGWLALGALPKAYKSLYNECKKCL